MLNKIFLHIKIIYKIATKQYVNKNALKSFKNSFFYEYMTASFNEQNKYYFVTWEYSLFHNEYEINKKMQEEKEKLKKMIEELD